MNINKYHDIIRLAMTKKSFIERSIYFFKGLLFAPFLDEVIRGDSDESVSGKSQAGDDIYPLF